MDIECWKIKVFGWWGRLTGNYYRQTRLILDILERRREALQNPAKKSGVK